MLQASSLFIERDLGEKTAGRARREGRVLRHRLKMLLFEWAEPSGVNALDE